MGKVVQIYDNDCISYPASPGNNTGWFSDTYVNQSKIDDMVSEGVKRLTGSANELVAWTNIFPVVSANSTVGIKVNENNGGNTANIDWLPQLINATTKWLKFRGFSEDNIYIMDPSSGLASAMRSVVTDHYPDVNWYNNGNATWNDSILVDHKDGVTDSYLCDLVADLGYLIQMPIMKLHGSYVYTLTYKNCLGYKNRSTVSDLHDSLNDASENTIVDLYNHTYIKDKTKLIIGDAIYGGAKSNWEPMEYWDIWSAYPKRLFFSQDPVSIDSVMWDHIHWEDSSRTEHNAIQDAANRGHGTHGHWDNETNRHYSAFTYLEFDMDNLPSWEMEFTKMIWS